MMPEIRRTASARNCAGDHGHEKERCTNGKRGDPFTPYEADEECPGRKADAEHGRIDPHNGAPLLSRSKGIDPGFANDKSHAHPKSHEESQHEPSWKIFNKGKHERDCEGEHRARIDCAHCP